MKKKTTDIKNIITWSRKSRLLTIFAATLLTVTACGDHDDLTATTDGNTAVTFSTEVVTEADTRVHTGTINDLTSLKAITDGFGVFAYLTENDVWDDVKTTAIPDFMYNQSVSWGIQYVTQDGPGDTDNPHYDWIYSPAKYWPNSSSNATPRRISFFAYAPFTSTTEVGSNTINLTDMPDDADPTPHLEYTLGDAGNQVDLLWACCTDATRNGQGLIVTGPADSHTYQKVPLYFHHALACVEFYVQRIYDEETYTGKKPAAEEHTKLFVSQLKLEETSSTPGPYPIYGKAVLSLEDGTWSNQEGITGTLEDDKVITYGEKKFQPNVSGTLATGTTSLEVSMIRDSELDKWQLDGYGVDDQERPLFDLNKPLLFIPQQLKLTPTLSYSMVTRDNELPINTLTDSQGNRYSRKTNQVEGTPMNLNLQAGKRYKILIHIGVETIRFEVISVEDWDFPIRFTPDVEDFNQQTNERILDEN